MKVEITNKVASFGVATPNAPADPIMVGLKYKKVPGVGSHFGPSTATIAMISFSSSLGSKAGREHLTLDITILRQLQSGRKSLNFPS
tara:strand:- start:915 stop:1175 length:261 start_codon:yes stop_codon:yes gene_type:complete